MYRGFRKNAFLILPKDEILILNAYVSQITSRQSFSVTSELKAPKRWINKQTQNTLNQKL